MDPLRILKALSNPHRLDIILWLKQPERKNSVYKYTLKLLSISNSVSVKSIQKRCGVSQSSISTFMSILKCGTRRVAQDRSVYLFSSQRRGDSRSSANGITKRYPSNRMKSTNY